MNKLTLICCLMLSCLTAFAKQTNSYVLGLDFGISTTPHLGNTISFPLGYSTFIYTPQSTANIPLRFGVSMSKHINFSLLNALQIGLSYQNISKMNVAGLLEQGISPPFSSFNYNYSFKSTQLLAEAKYLHQWSEFFYPYLIGGIGAGFNRASNYSTSIPGYLTLTPVYSDKSKSSLSYSLGLGVDFFKFKPLAFGLGYRFSDLGQMGLGNGQINNSEITKKLEQSHVYLNTFLIELNCFF